MPSHKIQARELRDVNVNFVSFVKRGANRIPFRMTKGDDDMFDMTGLFFKKADAEEAAKVATRKHEDMLKAAAEVLTKAGYSIVKLEPASDGEGSDEIKNPAENTDAGGQREDGDGSDEGENPADELPDAGGPRSDAGVTSTAVVAKSEKVVKAATPNTMPGKSKVKINTVPVGNMATENTDPKKKSAEDPMDSNPNDEDGDMPNANETTTKSAKAKKSAKPAVAMEDEGDGGDAEDTQEEADANESAAAMNTRKADAARVTKTEQLLEGLSNKMTAILAKLDATDERVDGLETKFAKSDRMLAGMVIGQPTPELATPVRKSDSSFPLLDTAFEHSRA